MLALQQINDEQSESWADTPQLAAGSLNLIEFLMACICIT